MKTLSVWLYVLAISFYVSLGVLEAQTDSGFPLCNKDGSVPYGYNQCDCPNPVTFRGEFNDPKNEFRVLIPEGIVGIAGCTLGHSFRIYLGGPNSDRPAGDFPWNSIWVSSAEATKLGFPRIIEGWKQSWDVGIKEGRTSALHLDEPEQTSLASLPAIRLRASWSERDEGDLIGESIVANNPEKSIVYQIAIVSPADRWAKSRKLFETVVGSFRYVPNETKESTESIDSH